MSVTPSSMIVSVFRDRSAAEQAVDALYNSGFGQEQIQYMVPGTSGGFLEGLKSFFTGTNVGGENLADDLTAMGLSNADAEYYANEYNNGNPILIVRVAERGTEALNVLRQYGAYNTQTEPSYTGEATSDTYPSAAYTQSGSSTADMPPSSDHVQQSGYGAPGQYDNVQNVETQTSEEYPYAGAQPGNATPEYDLSDQDTQIITPHNDGHAKSMDAQAQDMQADTSTATPSYDTGDQASGTDTATREQEAEMPTPPFSSVAPQDYGEHDDVQASDTTSETDMYEQNVQTAPAMDETVTGYAQASVPASETPTSDQAPQAATTTPDQDDSSQTDQASPSAMNGYDSQAQQAAQTAPPTASQATDIASAQESAVSPEQTDELQQLQAQLQTLQQQLQEAKARLAEAKEQENQIRTAREREQQLQEARQQLQDVQAELQAALAEYQEVQSRIAQYQ